MNKLVISGGRRLYGEVELKAAKNAVLPILAASLLTDEKIILENCPQISDVEKMLRLLEILGARTSFDGDKITVEGGVSATEIPSELAKEIRSSIFLLGPVLARVKRAKVAYPGGCDIGLRPIDIHIKGFRDLNVSVYEEGGYIYCDASELKPADIFLDKISVGATENLMMAAVLGEGITVIRNAAKEPEIVDLAEFLNKMGAKIRGAGTPVIKIVGVSSLHGARHTPISDRIVAGTLLSAVATCGGEVRIKGALKEHLCAVTSKLSKSTCNIVQSCDSILCRFDKRMRAFDIVTAPYPAFPTDLQAQFMALAATASGTSVISETVFETRFKHAIELAKMGANIMVRGDTAIVRGVNHLMGAEVVAHDLRGGAALVVAALAARGETIVDNVFHIDRGYERIENMFAVLGADIVRI